MRQYQIFCILLLGYKTELGASFMPRYLIERTFPDGITLPGPNQGAHARRVFVENNILEGVTWIHSYVVQDLKKSFCIYDAPAPEALRRAAQRNDLPVDRITEVSLLDPYIYIFQNDSSAGSSSHEEKKT
jgi:hypothetical protein